MKKIILALIIAILVIGTISAQPRGGAPQPTQPQTTTIEGTLQLRNGRIAVSTTDSIVFVPGLIRYAGFIEGIKDGARISVTGFAFGDILRPVQFTVDGKTHELAANHFGRGSPGRGFGPGPGPSHRGHGGWQCCHGFNCPAQRHGHHGGRRGW
jgi:hypothetical protein